jgi:cell division protein FtsI (penicillin-binding protein 3)
MRLWCVTILFALIWGGLWYRAFHLQMIAGPDLAARARRLNTGTELVEGVRGRILDRNGNILARSLDCPSVWANPRGVEDKGRTAAVLARHLNMPADRLEALLREDRQFVWIRRKVDLGVARKIKDAGLAGVHLDSEYERVYPYRHLAGQLLGFVNIDDKGLEGLELAFEDRLSGQRVRQRVGRDALGRLMVTDGAEGSDDLHGEDLRLTLDAHVQFFAEEALAENVEKYGAKWGGCIVVDVPTGDILAWAQYPFFDPNRAGEFSPAVRRNRLSSDALEQGSTIKSFLIAAALEEKVVNPETPINCEKGRWKLGKSVIHDTHAYASLTVDKILHVSSNIGAAKIGFALGAGKYHAYLQRLGFGEKSSLSLAGEARGILRPMNRWSDMDLAASSFGQSFSATLAQMAQAYLCLASDGVRKPLRLVLDAASPAGEETEPSGRETADIRINPFDPSLGREMARPTAPAKRIFSPETMRQVRAMLREVVEEEGGTGRQARIPGLEVGGKTGTAQKAAGNGKYGEGRVGSFVGMLPIENPRYLICVLLDEPSKTQYGGVVATPVFRHVALRTMAYHGLLPDSDDPMVLAIAEKRTGPRASSAAPGRETGSSPGAPARTPSARPEGGGIPAAKGPPDQEAGPPPEPAGKVPGLVGLGVRSAVVLLARHGVVPVIKGKGGFVARQTPDSGAAWPDGNRECTLWLEERAL